MTIDEAIAHAREVAKRRMAEYENHYDKDTHYYPTQCKKCAEEHIQLAEWLLEKDGVKQEIHRLKQDRLNREFLSESDVFQKYMDIAFADVTDFVEFGNEDVDVILDTGERKTITVSHVNIKNDADVDGTIISEVSKGKDGVKVKLADRMKALQWLTDHMDLATDKQKAEIALLKAKVQTDDGEEIADDGFLDALNGTAAEDWGDEENQ